MSNVVPTPSLTLTEEFRESLKRTADWLENLLTEQRAGPGKAYTQPRTIQVDVWDNCDAGGESVDGFTFDDGEVEYIVGLIRAALLPASETTDRDAIIEECAKAIEPANHPLLMAATKVIRALKKEAPQSGSPSGSVSNPAAVASPSEPQGGGVRSDPKLTAAAPTGVNFERHTLTYAVTPDKSGNTPRTDQAVESWRGHPLSFDGAAFVKASFARQLERELAAKSVNTLSEVLRLAGWEVNSTADVQERVPASATREGEPTMICPRCKVDRFKAPCPNHIGCPMVGDTRGPA